MPRCGRNHLPTSCYLERRACFNCEKQGHHVKECLPTKTTTLKQGKEPNVQGRNYAIIQQDSQLPNQ